MNNLTHDFVKMENITKDFGVVRALDGVSISFKPGEIHAIVGENGAGKSTLIKILMGAYQLTSGDIYIDGQKVNMSSQSNLVI